MYHTMSPDLPDLSEFVHLNSIEIRTILPLGSNIAHPSSPCMFYRNTRYTSPYSIPSSSNSL